MRTKLAAATILLVTCTNCLPQGQPPAPSPRYVEGELLVKFRGGPRGLAAEHVRNTMQHEMRRNFDQIGWQQIGLPRGIPVEDALGRYRNLPGVLAAEPNGVSMSTRALSPASGEAVSDSAGGAVNDPLFAQQYALEKIAAPSAWAITTGSTNVVVAVLDSGITYTHEDLVPNMWRNPDEIPGNGVDDDGNGYVDDIHGIDTTGNDSDPRDEGQSGLYHGTACAGIIGAVGNNGKGIAGINWSVQLMAVRMQSTSPGIVDADMLEALNYVVMMKRRGVNIRVVSMSWGDTRFRQSAKDAHDIISEEDILQVVAVDNAGRDQDVNTDSYPDNYQVPSILTVTSANQTDQLTSGANWGRTNVDLAAPGVGIMSVMGPATNGYGSGFTGTSFACPHASGAAALLFAANPRATALEVKSVLIETVDVLPAFTNRTVSNGRLNVARALLHPAIVSNQPPFIAAHPTNHTIVANGSASFAVLVFGSAPLNFQWRYEGADLVDATNSTLALSNVQTNQAGRYAVLVANPYGAVTSAVAVLSVLTPVTLLDPLPALHLSAVPGDTVTLAVRTVGALPIGYRWRHLRTNGTSVNVTNFVLNHHTCFLTFAVGANSAGAYTVILTNAAQTSSALQRTNTVLTVLADSDGDGLSDAWEMTHPTATEATSDPDGDGLSNWQEYIAGTDPADGLSKLQIEAFTVDDMNIAQVHFLAVSNRTYTLETRSVIDTGMWSRVADVVAAATNRTVEVPEQTSGGQRFYRLATPRKP